MGNQTAPFAERRQRLADNRPERLRRLRRLHGAAWRWRRRQEIANLYRTKLGVGLAIDLANESDGRAAVSARTLVKDDSRPEAPGS